ncbi:MAG: dephospho-CoA kinase [Chloroflexi bacterium]|nr:MAG: dephospho-CoA kinase [Chloroflexota bacterium]
MSATRVRVIGIGGGAAAGKSTLVETLMRDGTLAQRIGGRVEGMSADAYVREAAAQEPLRSKIAALYPAAVRADGSLDRTRLARAAFTTPALLTQLEALQWPLVAEELRGRIAAATANGARVLLVEAIALIGSPLEPLLDACLLVDLPSEERLARAVSRGTSLHDAVERDAAQAMHLAALRAASPVHIDGSGSPAHVAAAAAEAIAALCSQDGERADPTV